MPKSNVYMVNFRIAALLLRYFFFGGGMKEWFEAYGNRFVTMDKEWLFSFTVGIIVTPHPLPDI